jgi:hypothetical protein
VRASVTKNGTIEARSMMFSGCSQNLMGLGQLVARAMSSRVNQTTHTTSMTKNAPGSQSSLPA